MRARRQRAGRRGVEVGEGRFARGRRARAAGADAGEARRLGESLCVEMVRLGMVMRMHCKELLGANVSMRSRGMDDRLSLRIWMGFRAARWSGVG